MSKEKRKNKGTFTISILGTENATWQGRITWTEKNKIQYFRSALELLKLIDGVMKPGGRIETAE